MATSKELLTNLADELRTLTNTTDKMGLSVMAEHVSDANTEVDEQDALVTELMEALQGKSVPGGGSGSAVETCTLTLSGCRNLYYLGIDGTGNTAPVIWGSDGGNSAVEIVKGTLFTATTTSTIMRNEITDGISSMGGGTLYRVFYLSPDASESQTLTIVMD